MDTEIDMHIKSCDKCQKTRKDKRGSTTFASPLPQCSEPNQRGPGLFKVNGIVYIFRLKPIFTARSTMLRIAAATRHLYFI